MTLEDLAPDTPMGLAEISAATRIAPGTLRNWHNRGHLASPRWIVSARPAWSAADVAAMLATIPLHWRERTGPYLDVTRCAHACVPCAEGDGPPETYAAHYRRLAASYAAR